MIFFCLAAMAASAWGVGEVVFQEVPSLIECGVPIQLNWTYVGNASSVFSNGETLYVTLRASVTVMADVVSPRPFRYPATSAVVRFTGPRASTPVDAVLDLYGVRIGSFGTPTGSTQPNTFKSQFTCCADCCRAAPNECAHVNATYQCAGRLCAPAWCPTPSAVPGLFGCPCSTNVSLPVYQRCAGDYSCDSNFENGLCTVAEDPNGDRCNVASGIDSCSLRNSTYYCYVFATINGCRRCTPGARNCRCDDRRECTNGFCADGRCGSVGCRFCPPGRWGTCASGLVRNEEQLCETAPNVTETCTSAAATAAQQCDYATQQSDIDDLLRSAPFDESLPVQPTPAIVPLCTKLRQLLICRARVLDGSGCADTGIGATVARLCEAIPAARLAALNCGMCEPESCDAAKPACLRGLACIGGKCIIDPQFDICRNAPARVYSACPDPAKKEDVSTVQLAARLGTKTAVVDAACAALIEARTAHSLCYARAYADAGCKLAQPAPRVSVCSGNGTAERIAAIGCSVCASQPAITVTPSGTIGALDGPTTATAAPGGSTTAVVSADTSTGCRLAVALGLALIGLFI